MSVALLAIGLACVIAAIAGGRLTSPILQSKARRLGLAAIGAAALLVGAMMGGSSGSRESPNAKTLPKETSKPSGSGTNTAWAKDVGTLFADQHRCAELGRSNDAELAELELRSTLKDSLWVRGYSPKAQDNMRLGELETLSRSSGLAIGQHSVGEELCK
jgi:hypothetical protein